MATGRNTVDRERIAALCRAAEACILPPMDIKGSLSGVLLCFVLLLGVASCSYPHVGNAEGSISAGIETTEGGDPSLVVRSETEVGGHATGYSTHEPLGVLAVADVRYGTSYVSVMHSEDVSEVSIFDGQGRQIGASKDSGRGWTVLLARTASPGGSRVLFEIDGVRAELTLPLGEPQVWAAADGG